LLRSNFLTPIGCAIILHSSVYISLGLILLSEISSQFPI
jgi:hypothetical protein